MEFCHRLPTIGALGGSISQRCRTRWPMQMLRFLSLASAYHQLDPSKLALTKVIARRVEVIE